ncbi:E3 ubiquitin-protein ligase RNF146-A-like isoform X1 [Choristoneura fumiferana]|uniref:E3 ubiquitin-protein ligase RNF146-A-like isoform X1 n=1 Tax=Choristoneura fumiferana TaxID=7141 RepID=UPI003D158BEF
MSDDSRNSQSSCLTDLDDSDFKDQECIICTEKFNHPTRLPCGHVFCYLCVKGFPTCAFCRAEIKPEFLDHPVLIQQMSDDTKENEPDFQWYYRGERGWWRYDERSNFELETAFNLRVSEFSLRLAGADYIVNFQTMVQMRKGDRTKRRKVRRAAPTLPAKGIAGIKNKECQLEEIESEKEFNEADTIPLYSNSSEARAMDTDTHEMFYDYFYAN